MPTKINSDNRAIARSMAIVAALVLLGSVARAGREMAIAYRYGVGVEVDAYLFVFNLITWPVAVWFSVLTVVLVPLAAGIRNLAPSELAVFRAELFGLALVVGISFAAISFWLLPMVLRSPVVGLAPQIASAALEMVTPLSALAPIGVLVGLFSAWTMAAGRHANTLFESIPSLGVLLAVLLMPAASALPLVGGTVVGYVAQAAALWLLLKFRNDVEWPRLTMRSPHWAAFFRGFGIMLAGQVLMSVTTIIDQFYAGYLGAGNIATLNYANRVLALVLGLGAMAVSRATLPIFSTSHLDDGHHSHRLARRWVGLLFALGVALAMVGWFLVPAVVTLLFERGAFTAQNSSDVTRVMRVCLLQLPFYFSAIVLASYFSSRRMYAVLLWSGVWAILTKLAGNTLLLPLTGLYAIPLATAIMYLVNLAYLLFVFYKHPTSPASAGPLSSKQYSPQ